MAIGTAAAILGSAAIGAVGSALGGSSQKKAAKQAANAETQAAQMNINAAKEFRAENQANFQPFLNSGTRANSLIDSFLYGPAPANYYTGAPAAGTQAPAGTQQAPVVSQTPVPQTGGQAARLPKLNQLLHDHQDLMMNQFGPGGHAINGVPNAAGGGAAGGQAPGNVTTQQPQQNPLSPQSGFSAFVNSPYYQFGQNEGMRALNHGLASRGMLESGDAMKSAIRFGQDYGYSQGLMPYIGLAENQTNRGVQSAGGIAGVGVNALNTIANSNTASGNAIANAALAKGAAGANMWSGIAGAAGNALGYLGGGSSYGHFNPMNPGVGF